MKGFLGTVDRLTRYADGMAGTALVILMLLTAADVVLRTFGKSIVGTYELVGFLGAVVIGFSLARTSWERHHVFVDILVAKLPPLAEKVVNVLTRCAGITLFFLLGWNLIKLGLRYHSRGEVSPTLQVPFYPAVLGVGVCCFLECLVLICDLIKAPEDKHE
ncbi:MAG: TRAP transporter small permease [Syntrophorhabdales bacterium]|jgi:TRAP-type C4-dicarboxylate transport system permease small subunit